MKKKEYSRLGESVFHEVLDNGLHVFVNRKPDFQKSYAFFATNYGGNDTRFSIDGTWYNTPAGVAHYLEHKMFDTKEGNALQKLAANGASPNAFTSNAITGYYFECTEKFEENLKILLSFVSVPWFTKESVDKERGIIGQEIRMIEDNPEWCVFVNLMRALYQNHPMRNSVAGTVESIAEITADTLYSCHKAFYHPGDLVLCVAGDLDPETVTRIAAEVLPSGVGGETEKDHGPGEPERAAQALYEQSMEVSAPLFQVGVKLEPTGNGREALRQKLIAELACEAWLGNSTKLYSELYEQGLLNSSFAYGYEACPGCAFLCAGGESSDPKQVFDRLVKEARRLSREGIDEGLWRRLKKAAYGNMVRQLNSFQSQCVAQAEGFFCGYDYLTFPEVFDTVERTDAEVLLGRFAVEDFMALSVVWPKEAEV